MRLWLDDIRRPPNDLWTWVKTVEEAKTALNSGLVTECSLDHDLRAERHMNADGSGDDLVCWMVEHKVFPDRIIIHSHNRSGAQRMARKLATAGKGCNRRPYNPRFLTSSGVAT